MGLFSVLLIKRILLGLLGPLNLDSYIFTLSISSSFERPTSLVSMPFITPSACWEPDIEEGQVQGLIKWCRRPLSMRACPLIRTFCICWFNKFQVHLSERSGPALFCEDILRDSYHMFCWNPNMLYPRPFLVYPHGNAPTTGNKNGVLVSTLSFQSQKPN